MEKTIDYMLSQKKWCVLGANTNEQKYGNIVYRKLKSEDYDVYAINPNYEMVDGDSCYSSLSDLPEKVDCISVVLPIALSKKAVMEAAELGYKYMWFQPNTFNNEIIELCHKNGIEAVYDYCVLVELNKRE